MGGPEPLVSHLKLFSLEKAAFETLDSLDSPDVSRAGDESAPVGRRPSEGQEHRAPVDLKQQEDVLQQQLLKLKEVRESGDVAEEQGTGAHERSLLSPPQISPKASSPKSPLRRMSRDSSASQSPMSPLGTKQTRPTLRAAGAKAGKVPTTPLNSPMAADEKAPAIFVSQPARNLSKAAPFTGSGKVPRSEVPRSAPAEVAPVTIFRDKGLASALSNVPSRNRMGIPSEEIIPLELDPPPAPEPPQRLEALAATEGGGMPSEIMANWNSEADQEWWTRLHQQLETMHRDVQDYAQRSCPSRRFVRVGPGQLGGYGMMDPRGMEGMRLPVGSASCTSMLAPTVGTGDALGSSSLGHTRSGPLPRPPMSRNAGQAQNSWQPPMTPQTPQFEPPGLARQVPQQELQRQRVDSALSGSKVSVSETDDSALPSREVSRPPGQMPPSPVPAGAGLRSPLRVPVVYQAPNPSGPVPSERFVPVAPMPAPTTPPAGTRRPAGVVGQMPVMRSTSVGRSVGAVVSGYGHPSPVTPRGSQVGHVVQRQSSCGSVQPRAPSAPPTVLRCQMTPRSDTKLNVARVGTSMPGSMPQVVQYAAMPSGGQISWVKR